MQFAEQYAIPLDGELGPTFPRCNEFGEVFHLRWARLRFDVVGGPEVNLKVLVKVYRSDGTWEQYLSDTDPYEMRADRHRRATRDFFVHPFPARLAPVVSVRFAYIVHCRGVSLPSQYEYAFLDARPFAEERHHRQAVTREGRTANAYGTRELDAGLLQRDVDWCNGHFDSLRLIPKFTKGSPHHPYHPRRYIHEQIDERIRRKRERPQLPQTIRVCVDCIDDADFVTHLIHAADHGVDVQCIVDWRKMTLTNSDNYVRLKRAPLELLGVFCMPHEPLIEVAPDMHTKFLIFGEEDCILGSFNLTFERWGANWESGMSFASRGVCRLLDNIFQSIRGGVVQPYRIDPLSRFNLLYTFGCQTLANGKYYRPHQAVLAEVHRARRSLKLCLFLINELRGEYGESVVDSLIQAQQRGVAVDVLVNGHVAHPGDPGKPYSMRNELNRPLLPSVFRLRRAGIPVGLVYGVHEHRVPYCPIHSKYCIIDEQIVLDGSFNWYNASTFSHDLLVIAADRDVAQHYLREFEQIRGWFRVFY